MLLSNRVPCMRPCSRPLGTLPKPNAFHLRQVRARATEEFPAPNDRTLARWRKTKNVCFNIDGTLTQRDSLELLAEHMGVQLLAGADAGQDDGPMSGSKEAVESMLRNLSCTSVDLRTFHEAHPPKSRLVQGTEKLIRTLHARGCHVYLVSSGFKELHAPLLEFLGLPAHHLICKGMRWEPDAAGVARLVGVDDSQPWFAAGKAKVQGVARVRQRHPYSTTVMIGDGVSDMEAGQATEIVDLFIAFTGVKLRPEVARAADWVVSSHEQLFNELTRYKVAMVGSGAWACAAMHVVAQNLEKAGDVADEFQRESTMYVYEEDWQGGKLSDAMNKLHENPKYLPGVSLGESVRAVPNLVESVRDADVIIFCVPHQFMHGMCKQLIGNVKPGAIAISLVKGMRVRADGPQLVSAMVSYQLGLDCSVLMGANIAGDVGAEKLGEAVIGYNSAASAERLAKLFRRPYFRISLVNDIAGAEMCGTLKNIVAIAAGIVDGLDLGPNTKATIMRQGLWEMKQLSQALYPGVRDETFLLGCGIGDLIATCFGGRNVKVATAWTKAALSDTPKTFEELEAELLGGQKLQGVLTSNEVQAVLREKGWEGQYALFTTINRIINGSLPPSYICDFEAGALLVMPGEPGSAQVRRAEAPNC